MCTCRCSQQRKAYAGNESHRVKPLTRQCVPIFISSMDVSMEQCCVIKFCVHLKKNPAETILLLQGAFGEQDFGCVDDLVPYTIDQT